MSCEYIVGFISKKECGETDLIGDCVECNITVCQRHGTNTADGILCKKCLAKTKVDEEVDWDAPTYGGDDADPDDAFWDDLS